MSHLAADNTTWTTYTVESTGGGLESDGFGAMAFDDAGGKWLGNVGIVSHLSADNTTWTTYTWRNTDGGLASGLNFLGGPWNSLDRVYGGISVTNGLAAEATTIYTWLDGAGWSTFRDSGLGSYRNFMGWIVAEQTGYALTSGFAYQEPYFVEAGAETDKQCTEDDVFWQTWVP